MMAKDVATKKDTLPAAASAFEDYADVGFEDAGADAYSIPFLAILQSNSPQVKKSSGSYVAGAEEGSILNTVENVVYEGEKGVLVIPCAYRQGFVEWVPRDSGGGFVAEYSAAEAPRTTRSADNRDLLPNGNELIDTRYHSVLVVDEETGQAFPVVIAMTRTQVKKSKRWMSVMQGIKLPRKDGKGLFTAPMFSHTYRLKTVPEQKDEYSWYNWEVTKADMVTDPSLIAQAKQFHDALRKGEVREATDTLRTAEAVDDDIAF